MNDMEVWRPVIDAPGYFVSDHGRVRGISGRILKPRPNQQDYARVSMVSGPKRDRYIHDLVLRAFVGPRPSSDHEADHIDDDRSNNSLKNLRWLSLVENRARRKHARGENSGVAKLREYQVRTILQDIKRRRTDTAIAADFGISRRQVGDIRRGLAWGHLQ